MPGILRLTAAAALGGLSLLGCSGEEGSSDSPDDDVAVTTCTAVPNGKPVAEGTIANRTTKSSGYTFRIRFLDPAGNEVSQATDGVGRVDAAGTANWRAQGLTSANGPLTCKVSDVTRTEVP